ncbi:hypothetical protein AA416_04698 [Bacteroides cellulosilyticus]|jgi:hypothetical protein|nr:hypothetical protein AA416_04698 [Bacteroides cellulosilyticus]
MQVYELYVNEMFYNLLNHKNKYISNRLHIFNTIYTMNTKYIHIFANKSKLESL